MIATTASKKTRQLSYRKDNRAMRAIYGCPENFESPDYPTTTFPELVMGVFYSDR